MRALREFQQEGRTLSLLESQLIDQMLDDYKTSREAIVRLSQKVAIMATDRRAHERPPLIAIMPVDANPHSLDVHELVECLE